MNQVTRILLESQKFLLKAQLKNTFFAKKEKDEIKELIMRIDCELEKKE